MKLHHLGIALLLAAAAATGEPERDGRERERRGPPLDCKVNCLTTAVRGEAPALVSLVLRNRTERSVQGRLHLTVLRGGRPAARIAGQEVYVPRAVVEAGQVKPGRTPPIVVFVPVPSWARAGFDLRVRLRGERDWELGSHGLAFAARRLPRNLVLAVCTGRPIDEHWRGIQKALRWRSYDPRRRVEGLQMSGASTVASIPPGALPRRACGLLALDLLLIRPDALPDLEPEHLAALGDWLRAGGGAVLEGDAALPGLVAGWARELGVAVGAAGRLPAGFARHRVGLGRLLTVDDPDATPSGWHRQCAWAWGFRRDREDEIVRDRRGRWDLDRVTGLSWDGIYPQDGPYAYQQGYGYAGTDNLDPSPQAHPYTQHVISLLEPESVEPVPLWLIIGVLAVFVLAIGPADYLLLGLLRLRRLTWVSFPLMAIAATVLVVMVSRLYMGTADHITSLVVCDLGPGGTPARISRYDHHFLGSNGTIRVAVAHGIFNLIDIRQYAGGGGRQTMGGADRLPVPAITTEATGRQEVAFQGYKWTPALNRSLELAPEEETPVAVDVAAVEAALRAGTVGTAAFHERVEGLGFGGHTALYLLRGGPGRTSYGECVEYVYNGCERWEPMPGCDLKLEHLSRDLVHSLTVARPAGIHSRLSRLAPHGGRFFEDLPFLDPSDARSWAIVVVHLTGDELWLIRKPCHLSEEG